ncbi:MAG: radical SAM protein, partial [Eubacterium sp.]|nr:radical SAM protein [Eubacterium sp.]
MNDTNMIECDVCFHHCRLGEGKTGFCKGRRCVDGVIRPIGYGRLTALALDPIEKKPLNHFYPGSMIISVGGFGCNLACPFCQNYEISLSEYSISEAEVLTGVDDFGDASEKSRTVGHRSLDNFTRYYPPEELADICESYRAEGNIGIAFTYNEPTINYEYILDVAKLIHERDMKTVLVTNGSASTAILKKLSPFVDAMNVDLKSFDEEYYNKVLHGSLEAVKEFIHEALSFCHVEVTTLIIPGENDSEDEMRQIASWLAGE